MLIGGPDVWEVIRAVWSARDADPGALTDRTVMMIEHNTGVPARLIWTAVRYWAAYPQEIDTWIRDADEFEREALEAWERQQGLLAG